MDVKKAQQESTRSERFHSLTYPQNSSLNTVPSTSSSHSGYLETKPHEKQHPPFSMTMATYSRNRCLFCSHDNTPQAIKCDGCKGLVLPTRDSVHGRRISWTFFAFGPTAPSSKRTTSSFFSDSFADFGNFERAAIYIGDETRKVLLVQALGEEWKFSMQRKTKDNVRVVETFQWGNEGGDSQELFHRIVQEILDVDDRPTGKHDLSSLFA